MNSNGSSSSVVGDSETEDEGLGFFCPHEVVRLASVTPAEPDPMTQGSDLQVERLSGYVESSLATRRRNFRQRTAIQKLPYSLDRIRHKQLLQGIDVSSFDAVSENITLPERKTSFIERKARYELIERDKQAEELSGSNTNVYHRESGSPLEYKAHKLHESDDEADSWTEDVVESENESEDTTERQQILFRGRKIDIERGYRGILPRIAWEKAMKKNGAISRVKKRSIPDDRKGLAKRKPVDVRRTNQDQDLLNDLIVADDDLGEKDFPTSNYQSALPDEHFRDLSELERMSAYYRNKYHDDSSSESSIEEYNLFDEAEEVHLARKYEKQTLDDLETKFVTQAEEIDLRYLSDDQDGAIETDEGAIKAMLMKQTIVANGKKPKASTQRSRTRCRYRYGESAKRRPKTVAKPIRKYIRKTAEQNHESAVKPWSDKVRNHSQTVDPHYDIKERQKKLVAKSAKNAHFGIFPERHSELNRAVNTFTTVVEGVSRNYALSALQKQESDEAEMVEGLQADQKPKVHLYFRAIDALLLGKSFEPPDVVKLQISNKQFTLSRFHGGEICQSMSDAFEHIIKTGITNTELVELSESLTAFLLHLNMKSVYGSISDFHRNFRNRVNLSRQNAKPIHFFQIAVCQFMLLEITKYADLSKSFKLEIETEIIDHVVSFFKLLSVCYKSMLKLDLDYLHQACDIIAIVVRILDGVETLWKRVEKEKLSCCVAKILVDIFPTGKSRWSLLEANGSYDSMLQALSFVHYCMQKCQWQITNEVILLFDRVFKKRRFEDFAEEIEVSNANRVAYPRTESSKCQTVFNSYLHLLRSNEVTNVLVERIVPMSEIASSDSISVLINRLNLLIALAERSDLNSEKRLEELVRPVVQNNYLATKDTGSLKLVTESVLNGVLCLFDIHCQKKSPFRASILVSIYKSLVLKHDELKGIWSRFLEHLVQSRDFSERFSSVFLKTMYPCFLSMCQHQKQAKERLLLLTIYLRNLKTLGAQWVQANLFQAVKGVVHESSKWIDHYCTIGKFLVDHNIMTWWSFFVYNNVNNTPPARILFNHQVAQLCDRQSFDLIKRSLFETAVESFFQDKSALFVMFVTTLIDREKGHKASFKITSIVDSCLNLLQPFVSTLINLSYGDLILRLVSDIRLLYHDKQIGFDLATRLTNVFNLHFVDQVKDCYDFLLMKRDLGISDKEADKSSFRDAFKQLDSTLSQACYVERGLIQATLSAAEISEYLEKVKSLFTFSVLTNPFHFVVSLIDANLRGDSTNRPIKIRIVALYLRLVNEILLASYGQVSPDAFLEQCRLFRIICERLPLAELASVSDERSYAYESIRFQIIVLKIAQGFLEENLLLAHSKEFLRSFSIPNELEATQLSEKLDVIVRETAGQTLRVDSDCPQPDYEGLRSLIELKESRSSFVT